MSTYCSVHFYLFLNEYNASKLFTLFPIGILFREHYLQNDVNKLKQDENLIEKSFTFGSK